MVNLFDIMREAQGGQALDRLGREFNLTSSKVHAALGAMLPAFSLGLKNSLYNPAAFGPLVESIASGRYLPFFDGRGTSAASLDGGDALLRLFGSPEATQRVAEQGSAMAGIGLDVMQRMMPMVAATLIGGLYKYASLQGIGDLLARWSEAFHRAHAATRTAPDEQALKAPPPAAIVNPFEWWSSLLLPTGAPSQAGTVPPRPAPDDPIVSAIDAWGAMVTAMLGAPPAPPPAEAKPSAGSAAAPDLNPFQILARMFDAGREVQAQYLDGMTRLLDGGAAVIPGPRSGARTP